ncbi:MAG TPA: prepilin-type N-terminal cleavage/methylation domain-containing protein [Acidimicrobiales bacterium]|jgi:general secretion pathway protein G|nr:prepilin-type N-terminal cleavage/methylation domain-containing protein [Acidimicrobiales bacterium]
MQGSLDRLRARREQLEGSEGGFTLIELLIVIVILGILAAIVVFAVQNLTQQSSNASCQSDWKTVEVAAEAYKAQMGAYPSGVTALLTTATSPTSGQTVGPWLKDTPGGTKYSIVVGSANLTPAAAVTALGGTPSATDGVIWIGTPGTATQYNDGKGGKDVTGTPWTYTAGSATSYTASAACTNV